MATFNDHKLCSQAPGSGKQTRRLPAQGRLCCTLDPPTKKQSYGNRMSMTTETTPEIKHCPFCGSLAWFEYAPWNEDDQSGDDGSGKVECIKCFASIGGSKDDAIEKWNTRVEHVSGD